MLIINENKDLEYQVMRYKEQCAELEKENAELRKVAEFQQSSNISRYFENKKLKEGFAVGSTFNKALNSMNKNLEEERDKYRNMVFDLQKENAELKEELTKKADTNHSLVEQMADLESENAENESEARELNIRIDGLIKENAELKEKYVKECEDVAFVVTNYNKQLTKAKEIIKELVRVEYADFTNGDYSNELSKVLEQAEQFLSEVEK